MVGGAGSLYALRQACSWWTRRSSRPSGRPGALAAREALNLHSSRESSLDWTFLSRPPCFWCPGERRGSYRLGERFELVMDTDPAKGPAHI